MANELSALKELTTRANDIRDELRELERIKIHNFAVNEMKSILHSEAERFVLQRFDEATKVAPEFSLKYPETQVLRERIREACHQEDFIVFMKTKVKLNPKAVLGDWGDFKQGINEARNALDIKPNSKLTRDEKAAFWRDMIYIPARGDIDTGKTRAPSGVGKGKKLAYKGLAGYWYSKTMAARFKAWGNKNPWWLILEYGNTGSEYAYPKNSETGFMAKAEADLQLIFKQQVSMINDKIEVEINTLLDDLLVEILTSNTPVVKGQVLRTFSVGEKKYQAHITPRTGQIGVRGLH